VGRKKANPAIGGDAKAALFVAGLLILLAVVIGDFAVSALVALIVTPVLMYVMTRVPLRHSMMTLMFCGLTLENPAEGTGCGVWESPFQMVGGFLLNHINTLHREAGWTGALAFSGMEVCFATLLLVAFSRRASRSKMDGPDSLATPKPMLRLASLSMLGTLFVWLSGMVRGGDFRWSLWQVNAVLYLPIVFYLFQAGLRGPQDFPALAKIVIVAAVVRALFARWIYYRYTVLIEGYPNPPMLPYATSHHDSMLFAAAVVLIIAIVIEKTYKGSKKLLFLLPILALGMKANNRRMVWVQVAGALAMIYFVSPDNRFKKMARRAVVGATPLACIYALVGWNSGMKIFRPVQMMKSVVDAKTDASSFWRELENYDLIMTLRHHFFLGSGYGHPYEEIVVLPAVPYDLERYLPHNSVLGLWAYAGYFGYTAMTLLWAAGVYLGIRAYHLGKDPVQRAAGLVTFAAVLIYMVQCWGDMGLGTWTGVYLVGSALAVAGKLAAASGEWSKKSSSANAERSPRNPPDGVPDAEQAA
jgi:hypothetical protein